MRWDDERPSLPASRALAARDARLGPEVVGEHCYGHRFRSGPIEIADAAGYVETLRAADVEPDSEERRTAIVAGLDALGEWSDPNAVLEEVVYLVEKAGGHRRHASTSATSSSRAA